MSDLAKTGMTLAVCVTLQDYADYYGKSLSTIKRLKELGANLEDEQEVSYLDGKKNLEQTLAEYRAGASLPASTEEPGRALFTLEDSLQALRDAEGILYQTFKVSEGAGRSQALGQWLKVQDARKKLEIEIHEAERLSSESLPMEDVKKVWSTTLQRYRSELEAIPSKWASFLFEKEKWKVEEELKRLTAELVAKHLVP